MSYDNKEFSHTKLRVKYKTRLNLVWGKPLKNSKKEALAYSVGFPATLYMTDRRIFVIGTFMEKRGLFRKKIMNTVYYEAGLQYVKTSKLEIYKKVKSGYISFKSPDLKRNPDSPSNTNSGIPPTKVETTGTE